MGKLTLTIDTGNAAFDDNETGELARIMAVAGAALGRGSRDGILRDENGNRVGKFRLTGARKLYGEG